MLKKIEFTGIDAEPIEFCTGVNLIFGDKVDVGTNNSVGKSLCIEVINHLLGANRSEKFDFMELKEASVRGFFSFNNKEIIIERFLNSEESIKKKSIFVIKNDFETLNQGANGIISDKDWLKFLQKIYVKESFLSFRSFNAMFLRTQDIEDFKRSTKENPANDNWSRGRYNSYFLDIGYKIIDSNKHYNERDKKAIKRIAPMLEKVINQEEEDINHIQTQYIEKSLKLRRFYDENRVKRSKIKVLEENLNEITSISEDNFKERFNLYKMELREFLLKNYEEVRKFHINLVKDNKSLVESELEVLKGEIRVNNKKIERITEDKKFLEEKIKEFEGQNLYKNATRELLSKFLGDQSINELVGEVDKISKDETTKKVQECIENSCEKIVSYKEFLLSFVNKLYPDITDIDFNIYLRQGNLDVNFEYQGTDGEGKGTIRTLLYLILLLDIRQGGISDYLILDSKVIDSVDIDILDKFLEIMDEYGKEKGVQIICAGNKQNFKSHDKYYIATVLTPEKPLFNIELNKTKKDKN